MSELIKISVYQRRVWGENGTPQCANAIREQIKRGDLPGKQIGKLFYIDWTRYQQQTGNSLVDRVLNKRRA
ncbi:hypothetical protein SAMN05216421_1067 [Halopseudomonas xinjiangensis]|uniref:Uncharacterized protein n=1 Tax=Halopseudomonas xinjiangensis TaxID=487184 RepID=A0A1H1Q6H2_9GAMM|nr:hypothetical protein [Halopseudomonas xinjiangensis]SDS18903.1 hypothetical protein SAMN05216421_1067 [Halopseudomonas xinjiangensis]